MNRRQLMLFSAAMGAMSLPARSAFAKSKIRIAFANYNSEAAFGGLVLKGMVDAGKAAPNVELTLYDNQSDPEQVVRIARMVALLKPDVFIEYNDIAPKANPEVKRIMEGAGIRILSVETDIPGTPLYAVDNVAAGYQSGYGEAEAAKKRWGADIEPAVLILGLPEAGILFKERAEGARQGITKIYPTASVTQVSTKDDDAVARSQTSTFLIRNPGKKIIIWAHEDAKGIAALTAAKDAHRANDVVIASTGGEPVVFPLIAQPNSPYIGTFSYFPQHWGYDMIPLAVKLAQGEKIPDITHPSLELFLTAENIRKYYKLS